jgi:hypothetical protein
MPREPAQRLRPQIVLTHDPSSCLHVRLEGWAGVLKGDLRAIRALALLSSDVTYGPYEAGRDSLLRDTNVPRGMLISIQGAPKKVLIAPPWNVVQTCSGDETQTSRGGSAVAENFCVASLRNAA